MVSDHDVVAGLATQDLRAVSAAVRELSEGRASMLAIEGEAGIGKTRLVQCVVDDARSRDLAVFSGQAHPFERTRPFGVVAAALDLSRRSVDPRRAAIGALLAGHGDAAMNSRWEAPGWPIPRSRSMVGQNNFESSTRTSGRTMSRWR